MWKRQCTLPIRFRLFSVKSGHVFFQPTFDRIAKYILAEDETVRIDILKAFTGIKSISSATPLDEHFNAHDEFSTLRSLLHSPKYQNVLETIKNASDLTVSIQNENSTICADFLKEFSEHSDDILQSWKYRLR
jgi:hypothetical protein